MVHKDGVPCDTRERFSADTGREILYPLEEWVNGSTAATIRSMRQLPERCESCKEQISTLETCVLPDGTEKRGA